MTNEVKQIRIFKEHFYCCFCFVLQSTSVTSNLIEAFYHKKPGDIFDSNFFLEKRSYRLQLENPDHEDFPMVCYGNILSLTIQDNIFKFQFAVNLPS